MPKVYDYLNYNQFLNDYYQEKKKENSFFSYRYMGRKLSLDPGFLVKVLQGKMPLSLKSVPRIMDFCGLVDKEAEYFHLLVKYGRSKNVNEIKKTFEKLMELRDSQIYKVEEAQYSFYKKWYHTAIRCLLSFDEFNGDYKALASKLSPKISIREAKESVELLESLGFIEKDEQGKYTINDALISTGDKWQSAAVRNFQLEALKLAMESLERHPKESRDISTVTVAIPYNYLDEIRSRAKEFRRSVLQMDLEKEQPDSVYQINVQIVPLTEVGKKKR